MKKTAKRALSLFLTLIMLLSCFSVGFVASAQITPTDHKPVYIVVPETIYMTPSSGNSTTAQYYINNTFNSSNNTISTDANASATSAKVYFKCADATALSVSVNGSGREYTIDMNKGDGGYFVNENVNELNGVQIDNGVAAGNTSYITWTFTATIDGKTETFKAYTELYAPYITPVMAATRAKTNGGGEPNIESYAYISGIHGVESAYSHGSTGTRCKVNLGYLAPLLGVRHTAADGSRNYTSERDSGVTGTLSTDDAAIYVNSENTKSYEHQYAIAHSPTGYIYADTSRNRNLNTIPNISIGFNVTYYGRIDSYAGTSVKEQTHNAIFRDYTDKGFLGANNTATNGNLWGDTVSSNYSSAPAIGSYQSTSWSATPISKNGSYSFYNGAWDRSITGIAAGGDKLYSTLGFIVVHAKISNKGHAHNANIVYVRVKAVDKTDLRNTIRDCVAAGYQSSWVSSNNWSTFETRLREAYRALGNPMSTDTQISTARTNLKNAFDALTLRTTDQVANHYGVVRVLDETGTTTGYKVVETLLAYESLKPTADKKTDFSSNTYNGYNYKGHAVATTSNGLNSIMTNFDALDKNTYVVSRPLRTTAAASYSFYYQAKDIKVTVSPSGHIDSDGDFYRGTWNGKEGSTEFQASVGSTFMPVEPKMDCYIFSGWNVEGATKNTDGSITFTDSNATLTAQWVAKAVGDSCHQWAEDPNDSENLAATCTIPGNRVEKCTLCGVKRNIPVPATGIHTRSENVEYGYGTASDGTPYHTYGCLVCSQTIQEDCTPRSFSSAPTCTQTGAEGHICEVCKHILDVTYPAALGHTYVIVVNKAATCTADGAYTATCSVCEETVTGTIAARGEHKFDGEATVTQEPSCFDEGKKDVACSNTETSGVITLDGKEYTVENAYEACAEKDKVTIAPTGNHVYATEWTYEIQNDCTTKGTKYHACTTEGCDARADITMIAPRPDHVFNENCITVEGGETAAATCTKDGFYTVYCQYHNDPDYMCNCTGTVTVPKLGHDYEGVVYEADYADGDVEAAHTHSKYCKRTDCDDKEASKQTGNCSFAIVDHKATCTTDAYTVYACSDCDGEYTVTQPGTKGHKKGELNVSESTAATCTTQGKNVYYCTVCDEKIEEIVPTVSDAHNWSAWTSNGNSVSDTHTRTCTYNTEHKETAAHDWDNGKTEAAAKCGEVAHITYTCKVCGETRTVEGEELAHDWGEWVTDTEATCAAVGSKHRDCQREGCNARETAEIATNPDAHPKDMIRTLPEVKPTCTETGYTEGSHCDACGNDVVAQKEVAPLGHDLKDVAQVDPTCTEPGKEAGKKCSRCDYTEGFAVIEPLGHIEVVDEAKAPTCTETGLTEGKHCGRCGVTIVEQKEVAELGHTVIPMPEKDATCEEAGSTGGTMCSVCFETITESTLIPKLGHNYVVDTTIAATCTQEGAVNYVCTHIGCTKVQSEKIEPLGHRWGELQVVSTPTCTERGVAEKTCTECGAKETIYISVLNHVYTDSVVAPTCTTDGYVNHICILCGHSYIDSIVTAPGHDYRVEVTPVTCETMGYTSHVCRVCGDTIISDQIPAIGHNYVENVIDATCGTEGYTEFRCINCGKFYQGDVVPALGHNFVETIVAPSCTVPGYTAYTCSRCGFSYIDDITEAVGHNYKVTDRVGATATKSGYVLYTCTACGSQYKEMIYIGGKALVCETLKDVNGRPMPDATITVTEVNTGESFVITTDKNGYFTYVFPEGDYTLKIHKDLYENTTGRIFVANGTAEVDLPQLTNAKCDCLCHQTTIWSRIYRIIAKILALFGNKIQCCDCCELWD